MSYITNQSLAPVALFVYNRPNNVREVVEALQKNYLASETELFVFSDAAKSERHTERVTKVRKYLKTITGFKSVTVIERSKNFYIERNIIEGVTELVNRFGHVIVLEDDGVTAPYFLTFMNNALSFYDATKKVMHIGTFTFIKMPDDYRKTFLWRYAENTGGGWGTWKDRWEKFIYFKSEEIALAALTEKQKEYLELGGSFTCLGSLKLKPIPWDICWNIAIVRNNGLTVNSPRALTVNNGLFNGTHFTALNRILGKSPFATELSAEEDIIFEEKIEENQQAISLLKAFYTKLSKRKRDKVLGFFVKILVTLKITKMLKRLIT